MYEALCVNTIACTLYTEFQRSQLEYVHNAQCIKIGMKFIFSIKCRIKLQLEFTTCKAQEHISREIGDSAYAALA